MRASSLIAPRRAPLSLSRRSGEVDMADFALGMFLVFFLPVVCYFFAGVVMTGGTQTSIKEREKPEVDPPPDNDELAMRFKAGEELLRQNAKGILKLAESLADPNMKEQLRPWVTRALKAADTSLENLAQRIQAYPEIAGQAGSYLANIATLRKEVQADLARAKSLDFFGRDTPAK